MLIMLWVEEVKSNLYPKRHVLSQICCTMHITQIQCLSLVHLHNRQHAEQKTSKNKHITPTTTTENYNQHRMTDSQEPKADIKPANHYCIKKLNQKPNS